MYNIHVSVYIYIYIHIHQFRWSLKIIRHVIFPRAFLWSLVHCLSILLVRLGEGSQRDWSKKYIYRNGSPIIGYISYNSRVYIYICMYVYIYTCMYIYICYTYVNTYIQHLCVHRSSCYLHPLLPMNYIPSYQSVEQIPTKSYYIHSCNST